MSDSAKDVFFKVSAQNNRLISHENMANVDTIIIELLKNSHDADTGRSMMYFTRSGEMLCKPHNRAKGNR